MPASQPDASPLMAPLSEEETDELDRFLLSDLVPEEALTLSALDGYLAAIVIGPEVVLPSRWLPRVWGARGDESPAYESLEQAQRILTLIMRLMNSIVWCFEHDPDSFEPMFDAYGHPDEPAEHLDGEMWAHGFLQGIALSREDWQPMLDDETMAQPLRPLHLLGAEDATAEEEALVRTPDQRAAVARTIPAAVADIYRYWLPCRTGSVAHRSSPLPVRSAPGTGRNDPCPCGSGRKFKKCCGAPATLH